MESGDLWRWALLILCLALSAVFSASETSFIALPRLRLAHLVSAGRPGASRVSKLLEKPEKLLATVLLSNNLVNISAASLATALAIDLLGDGNLAIVVSTVLVTAVLLIFGETLPKTIAWNRSELVAFAVARPITLIQVIFSPVIAGLQFITSLISRVLGIKSEPMARVSEEELRTMIAMSVQSGAVAQSEALLLERVFHFGDRQLQEIMTPRPEIVWVELGTTLGDFLKIYSEHSHTRFPVYEGTIENVVGVLSVKDVLSAMGRREIRRQNVVTTLLRPAYFAPETKPVGSAFTEMQKGGYGLALTIDEYGGIAGLVTLKQLLGVIVGEMDAEGAEGQELYRPVDERTFWLDAGASVIQVNEDLQLGLPEGDYQTVAGFILDRLGRIPDVGDSVSHGNLRFTVRVMDGVRIEEVEVERLQLQEVEAS